MLVDKGRIAVALSKIGERVEVADRAMSVRFVISGSGKVSSSSATGVDPDVASCVADVIRQIEVPKPKSGRNVLVMNPITFRPAGQ